MYGILSINSLLRSAHVARNAQMWCIIQILEIIVGELDDNKKYILLQGRHKERYGVPNHRRLNCLLNRLFKRRSKKTSKLRATGLCAGNSPGTSEFPTQRASDAENVSIWWRHHVRVWMNDYIPHKTKQVIDYAKISENGPSAYLMMIYCYWWEKVYLYMVLKYALLFCFCFVCLLLFLLLLLSCNIERIPPLKPLFTRDKSNFVCWFPRIRHAERSQMLSLCRDSDTLRRPKKSSSTGQVALRYFNRFFFQFIIYVVVPNTILCTIGQWY